MRAPGFLCKFECWQYKTKIAQGNRLGLNEFTKSTLDVLTRTTRAIIVL